jgi:hypothetical protein
MKQFDHPETLVPGLRFAIAEVEAVRRIKQSVGYNASALAAIDDVLVTLRAALARGGRRATSDLMGDEPPEAA